MSQKWGEFWEEVRYNVIRPNKNNNFKKGDNTMNLNPIRQNMTELQLEGGLRVLFSYHTPVACNWTNGAGAYVYFVTEKKWSNTTTRHINLWTSGMIVEKKSQEYFDNLIAEVK